MDADPAAPSQGRKLACIVSVDITGYSRLAEADEAAAVAAVSNVRARIDRAAATHGGRVFSTAGDGFMLEFPTASGALSAAEEIAASDGPQVRVGVHVGEVSSTEGGDMLGHGVNIAARIQQMAPAGGILVSADVKRSVRGDLGARLTPRGAVKLNKMDETLEVFQLDGAAGATLAPRAAKRFDWRWIAGGAAVVAILVLGAIALNRPQTSPPQARLAVLPFRTLGDGASLSTFAGGLSDRIVGALSSRNFLTVSPDQAASLRGPDGARRRTELGVGLILDGTVQGADPISIDARIEDPRSGNVLWSVQLQGDAAHAADLQARVAARIVAEMYCGQRAFRPVGGLSDPTALSAYLRACDLFLVHSDDSEVTYQLLGALRQVTAIAPRFSAAHSDIAKYEAYFLGQFPADQVASVTRDARAEATRALELDPHNADAYVARYLLLPSDHRLEGEQLLRRGLSLDPDWPHANGFLGNVLTAVGRVQEASDHYQRAAAANPLSGGLSWSGQNAIGLDNIGRVDLADRAMADISRLWASDDPDAWRVGLTIALSERRWDAGLALVNASADTIPKFYPPSSIAAYRGVFAAGKAGTRARLLAERNVLLGMTPGTFPIRALTLLGFTDDAFAVFDRSTNAQLEDSSFDFFAFAPSMAPFRRDPRFMRAAARLGLIDYWRATHTQPDFCNEPNLPYNCIVEEERAQPTAH